MSSRVSSKLLLLLFLLVAVPAVVLAPRALEAHAAVQWTRFLTARAAAAARPGDNARQAARWAVRALDAAAPLPDAAEAARLALDLAKGLTPKEHEAALSVFTDVRSALDRARASKVRGLGLAELAEDARRLETDAAHPAEDATK
jgi:hypothetical protein